MSKRIVTPTVKRNLGEFLDEKDQLEKFREDLNGINIKEPVDNRTEEQKMADEAAEMTPPVDDVDYTNAENGDDGNNEEDNYTGIDDIKGDNEDINDENINDNINNDDSIDPQVVVDNKVDENQTEFDDIKGDDDKVIANGHSGIEDDNVNQENSNKDDSTLEKAHFKQKEPESKSNSFFCC